MAAPDMTERNVGGKQMIGDVEVGQTLGKGNFAKVKYGYDHKRKHPVAIKIINLADVRSDLIHREISIMKKLDHPNITKLFDAFKTQTHMLLFAEYCSGGELIGHLKSEGRLRAPYMRDLFRQMVSAVAYCHGEGIAHRDLKPENMLLTDKKDVKLIDFGLAGMMQATDALHTFCGSPHYVAPEVLEEAPAGAVPTAQCIDPSCKRPALFNLPPPRTGKCLVHAGHGTCQKDGSCPYDTWEESGKFCKLHTCPVDGCDVAKSSRESACSKDHAVTAGKNGADVRGGYDGKSADVWSLGVVLFYCMAGYPPFHSSVVSEMLQNISTGRFSIDTALFSPSVSSLLRIMLELNPEKRANIATIAAHPWLAEAGSDALTPAPDGCPLSSDDHACSFLLTETKVPKAMEIIKETLKKMGINASAKSENVLEGSSDLPKGRLVLELVINPQAGGPGKDRDSVITAKKLDGDVQAFHSGFHDLVKFIDAPGFKH